MPVETATYISQLNPAYPTSGDSRSEGDDHLRLGKQVLQNQFPNLGAAAVTATAAQLNLASTIASRGPVLITTGSPSAASSISISSGIDSTYEVHEWHFVSLVPSAGSTLSLRINNDSSSGGHDWVRNSATGTTTTTANGGATATEIALTASNADTTASGGGWDGWIRIYDAASTSVNKRIEWQFSYSTSSSSGSLVTVRGAGVYRATGAITNLQVYPSTGTVTGKHKFYGWVKS